MMWMCPHQSADRMSNTAPIQLNKEGREHSRFRYACMVTTHAQQSKINFRVKFSEAV